MRYREREISDRVLYGQAGIVGIPAGKPFLHEGVYYPPPFTGLASHFSAVHPPDPYTGIKYIRSFESISDVGGPRKYNALGKSPDQPCTSNKEVARNAKICFAGVDTNGVGFVSHQLCKAPSRVEAMPVLGPYDHAVLYGECYNELLPKLEGSLDLANFIYELKDFQRMLKHMSSAREAMDSIKHGLKQAVGMKRERPRMYRSETSKEFAKRLDKWNETNRKLSLARTAASADLSYHYALKPFVYDVARMSVFQSNILAQIKKLNDYGSLGTVHHAEREFQANAYSEGGNSYSVPTLTHYSAKGTYRLVGEMTYALRKMSQMEAVSSYLGINLKASTLWNMAPLSFVVDHYTNMGDVMLSLDRTDIDTKMSRLTESITIESSAIVVADPSRLGTYVHSGGMSTGSIPRNFKGTDAPVLAYRTKRSYTRAPLGVQYVRPPVLPRLKLPSLASVRKDMSLMFSMFGPRVKR